MHEQRYDTIVPLFPGMDMCDKVPKLGGSKGETVKNRTHRVTVGVAR